MRQVSFHRLGDFKMASKRLSVLFAVTQRWHRSAGEKRKILLFVAHGNGKSFMIFVSCSTPIELGASKICRCIETTAKLKFPSAVVFCFQQDEIFSAELNHEENSSRCLREILPEVTFSTIEKFITSFPEKIKKCRKCFVVWTPCWFMGGRLTTFKDAVHLPEVEKKIFPCFFFFKYDVSARDIRK